MNNSSHPLGASRRLSWFSGALACTLLVAASSSAATSTWIGGGYLGSEGTYWSDAANWNPAGTPPNGNEISIGSSFGSGRKILVTGPHSYAKLTFSSSAYNVNLSYGFGNPKLTLTTGTVSCSPTGVVWATPLHMSNLGTWDIGGSLKMTGQITGGLSGIGQYYFTDYWNKTGDGTLELAGNCAYKGTLVVKEGRVLVSSNTGLSPGRALWVDSESYTNPEVEIAAYVDPSIGQLVVRDGTITGNTGSSLTITSAILGETAEVNAVLAGTANITVEQNADAWLLKSNTFAGTITLSAGSELHIDSNASLGASGNTVVLASGAASLVSEGWQEDLASNRTLQVDGTLTLEEFDKIAADLVGAGTVEILGETSAELTGANPNFTGLIVRDGSVLTADMNGCLGYAWGVFVYEGDFVLDASNPAYGEPDLLISDLSYAPGRRLIANSHTEQFGTLDIQGKVTIQLDPATPDTHGVLTFENIDLPTTVLPDPVLLITNWSGTPENSGTDDRIICETFLTGAQLENIEFVGIANADGATQLTSGEIVPEMN